MSMPYSSPLSPRYSSALRSAQQRSHQLCGIIGKRLELRDEPRDLAFFDKIIAQPK